MDPNTVEQVAGTTIPIDDDEARLAAFGKSQVMKRNFNIWSLLFMSFCTSVTWEACSATMAQALVTGGSSSFVWGFLVSSTGAVLLALSLSEFASMIPTSGGQYHYVHELAPPRFKRIFSWFAGWITIWAWITSSASAIFSTVMSVQAMIILFVDSYMYERWHTSLIFIAFTTLFTIWSIFGIKYMPHMTKLGIVLHIGGYISIMIYLLVKVDPKNTAAYVFTDINNLSGWENNGVAWSLGLLSSAIGLIGWDASTHLAEEMQHASRDLPITMWGAVAITGLLTFPWIIAVMFCIGDISAVLNGPVGSISPMVQLIYNVSGGDAATTVGINIFFILITVLVTCPSCITATSRCIWSFAREGGMPPIFGKVHPRLLVPVNALILSWFCVSVLSLIYIGNSTAFYSVASGVTIVMMVSYLMPIVISLIWGTRVNELKPGSFTLGKFRLPINIAAVAYSLYLCVFLCFPASYPTNATTMNYSVVVLAFGFAVAIVTWFIYGKTKYLGVVYEVDPMVMQITSGLVYEHPEEVQPTKTS